MARSAATMVTLIWLASVVIAQIPGPILSRSEGFDFTPHGNFSAQSYCAQKRVSIVAYCKPVDMRKGFEGLCGLVIQGMDTDPLDGTLYLFTNKTHNRAKVLCFDGTGFCVLAKRLDKGRFAALWKYAERTQLPRKKSELELFLEGSHLVAGFQVSPQILSTNDLVVKPT